MGCESPIFPNYDESILSIPNSILKACGIEARHQTLPLLDEALKRRKKIALVIFDGLGSAALSLAPASFLSRHKARDLTSVYPSTTTAALTTLYTGLSPIEHGWLGWSLWFKEVNQSVAVFPNKISGTDLQASPEHLGKKLMPCKTITELIGSSSILISPYEKAKAFQSAEMLGVAERFLNREDSRLAVCYNVNPDATMHLSGCDHPSVSELIRRFSVEVEQFASRVKDALIIVTADHGHKNVKNRLIDSCPEIMECLYRPYTMESRAASLFVKPEFMPVFEERWKGAFGDEYLLISKEEALSRNLFGEGKPHEKALEFIGDYIACALTDLCLERSVEIHNFASAHAGLTKEEMLVPLVLIET
jgi:hypothetical protein